MKKIYVIVITLCMAASIGAMQQKAVPQKLLPAIMAEKSLVQAFKVKNMDEFTKQLPILHSSPELESRLAPTLYRIVQSMHKKRLPWSEGEPYLVKIVEIIDARKEDHFTRINLDMKHKSKTGLEKNLLGLALVSGYPRLVQRLVEAGANPNDLLSDESFYTDVLGDKKDASSEVKEAAAIMSQARNNWALYDALKKNDLPRFQQLLKHGARFDVLIPEILSGSTVRALIGENLAFARLSFLDEVLKAGADPSKLLGLALFRGRPKLVKKLLAVGADPFNLGDFEVYMTREPILRTHAYRSGGVEPVQTERKEFEKARQLIQDARF